MMVAFRHFPHLLGLHLTAQPFPQGEKKPGGGRVATAAARMNGEREFLLLRIHA